MQARAERKRYYQKIFIGDLEKELGTGTRSHISNNRRGKNGSSGRWGKIGILDTPI